MVNFKTCGHQAYQKTVRDQSIARNVANVEVVVVATNSLMKMVDHYHRMENKHFLFPFFLVWKLVQMLLSE
jgi:hypothetical protein